MLAHEEPCLQMALFSPTWSGTCALLVAILWSPFALLLSLPSLVINVATSPVLLLSLVLFVLVITVVSAALAFDAVRGRIEKASDAGEEAEAHRRSSLG